MQETLLSENNNDEFIYLHDLHETFFLNETRHWDKRSINHMDDKQTEITMIMRQILISWLLEVCFHLKLPTIVYFMSINYCDKVLSRRAISRRDLQLVGVTCLFIACKLEMEYPPYIDRFSIITDNAYTTAQIVEAEALILRNLNYDLLVTTSRHFLEWFVTEKELKMNNNLIVASRYILEATILSYFIHYTYKPSIIALAVILFTKALCKKSKDCCTYNVPLFIEKWLINMNDLDALLVLLNEFYWKEFTVLVEGKSERIEELLIKYKDVIQWITKQ